jgi:phosphopantetheine adenylyltransferase
MAFENTITEIEMDVKTQQLVKGLREERHDFEPDLDVEGMSDSILSRLLGIFSRGR